MNARHGPGLCLCLCLIVAALSAGCSDGYPERDAVREVTPALLLRQLQDAVSAGRSDARAVWLHDGCTLGVEWADGARSRYDLLELRTGIPQGDDGEVYALLLEDPAAPEGRLLVGTSRWDAWATAQSSINHLRGFCARARGEDGAADPGPILLPG